MSSCFLVNHRNIYIIIAEYLHWKLRLLIYSRRLLISICSFFRSFTLCVSDCNKINSYLNTQYLCYSFSCSYNRWCKNINIGLTCNLFITSKIMLKRLLTNSVKRLSYRAIITIGRDPITNILNFHWKLDFYENGTLRTKIFIHISWKEWGLYTNKKITSRKMTNTQ